MSDAEERIVEILDKIFLEIFDEIPEESEPDEKEKPSFIPEGPM